MYPTLFSFGPITIYSYGFFLALAYLVATYIFWREGKKQGYQEEKLIDFSVASLVAAIFGGRLLYSILNYHIFSNNFLQIFFFWEGGFAYYGSLVAVFMIGILLVRKWRWSFFQVADISALAVLSATVIGKIGAFLSGNDFGSVTKLPWGVNFLFLEGSRHPTQLYEAAFSLILLILLYRFYKTSTFREVKLRSGTVFFYFLFFSNSGRFVIENFRGDSSFVGPFRVAAIISFLLAFVALLIIYFYQFRNLTSDMRKVSKYFFGVKVRFKNPLK